MQKFDSVTKFIGICRAFSPGELIMTTVYSETLKKEKLMF